jgi:hypothetical protein
MWLFECNDGSVRLSDCERYLQLAVDQGDHVAEVRLAVFLMSDVLGRFDFERACTLLERPSRSNRLASILRDSLSTLDYDLVSSSGFSKNGSIFSLLRWSSDDSIPLIQILNPELCNFAVDASDRFSAWRDLSGQSFEYLFDHSGDRSSSDRELPSLGLLASD